MDIAVRIKNKKTTDPYTVIVNIDDDTLSNPDAYYGACHDEVVEILGHDPEWIRILGKVTIDSDMKYLEG